VPFEHHLADIAFEFGKSLGYRRARDVQRLCRCVDGATSRYRVQRTQQAEFKHVQHLFPGSRPTPSTSTVHGECEESDDDVKYIVLASAL
jgi:hypothetical protein